MVLGQEITPKNDATLGLIFRLNALWAEVDVHAKSGDYDSWNNTLDAIYRNLLYRENVIVTRDTSGKIVAIGLKKEDEEEYKFLCRNISKFKLLFSRVRGVNDKRISKKKIVRSLWYKSVGLKDIWVRKLMNHLNLYIKETIKRPGSAMWGNR